MYDGQWGFGFAVVFVGIVLGIAFEETLYRKEQSAFFRVDKHGNPEITLGANWIDADRHAVECFANASINQFKATVYSRFRIATMDATLSKTTRAKLQAFAETLESSYPIAEIK